MILNPWILGLLAGHGTLLFIFLLAVFNAWQIYRKWNFASSSEVQYNLEKRTYLVSSVMNMVLAVQLVMLFLLVLAADELSRLLPGAMCASGVFSANEFGFPLLILKIGLFFGYCSWLVLNYQDNRSESYPLIRTKYLLLLILFPFVVAEWVLLLLFILNLNPTVITSCCGSIYSENASGVGGLVAGISPWISLTALLSISLVIQLKPAVKKQPFVKPAKRGGLFDLTVWPLFFMIGIVNIISFFSIYIYEMMNHQCPFCLIKREYHYIGFPIYFMLFAATAAGISGGVLDWFKNPELDMKTFSRIRSRLSRSAKWGMWGFWVICFSPFVLYYLRTGRLI